ncbi:MAG: protein translocase subunit SecD [Candidatus Tritonobacter lacicola]|nr:protein translocase subunit SecD [Candidatus Tritonobacter lacicola]
MKKRTIQRPGRAKIKTGKALKKELRLKVWVIAAVIAIFTLYLYPTARWASLTKEIQEELSEKWKKMDAEIVDRPFLERLIYKAGKSITGNKSQVLNLGLDLKGGMYVVLEVDMDKAIRTTAIENMRTYSKDLEDKKLPFIDVALLDSNASLITFESLDERDAAFKNITKGGVRKDLIKVADNPPAIEITLGDEVRKNIARNAIDQALIIIRNRVDARGLTEPQIQQQGLNKIIVSLPDIQDPEEALDMIGKTALLEFKLVAPSRDMKNIIRRIDTVREISPYIITKDQVTQENVPYTALLVKKEKIPIVEEMLADPEVRELIPKKYAFYWSMWEVQEDVGKFKYLWLLDREPSIKGINLQAAWVDRDQMMRPVINLKLDTVGQKKLRILSIDAVKKLKRRENPQTTRLAIVLDDVVNSAPFVRERLSGATSVITGNFTLKEANDLKITLETGALPAPVKIAENRTVGPALGRDSVRRGIQSAILGLVCVLVFIVFYYRRAGVIADFALCLNILIVLGALRALNATLTLPGIAGIILTIGMSVDANVLIYERIREELAQGKKIRTAIANGYKKALMTIIDANVTTFITALILYIIGTGPIRGFAITLMLGICGSMFTALFVTRTIFDLLVARGKITTLKMRHILTKPNFDFLGKRKLAYTVSVVLIVVGMATFVRNGKENLGIDFNGGILEQVRFAQPVSLESIRSSLKRFGLGKAQIQHLGTEEDVLIRADTGSEKDVLEALRSVSGGEKSFEIMRSEQVGPTAGKALRIKAIQAIVAALMCVIAYIWWRFRHIEYGLAAVVALAHDVLITVGIFAITGREINLPIVAALLMIVGYSLNDTIVIFVRIREDLKLMKGSDFRTVINTSINQTLSRTILTSLTTLAVVVCLYLLGGEVINDFAFALMIGVIVGTYSSIYVASPLLLLWRRGEKARA